MPEVWRDSIAELLELAEEMDRRIDPIDRELGPTREDRRAGEAAGDDPRRRPAAQPHLRRRDRRGLALLGARQAGRLRRPRAEGEPVGRALGDRRALEGRLAGRLRWAAVEAANQAWRPSNPWHGHYLRVSARHGKNPAKSSVARKLLIAAWHMLSRQEPFNPPAPANSSRFLTA